MPHAKVPVNNTPCVIDFDAPICGYDGQAIKTQLANGATENFTLKFVCVEALSGQYEDEKGLSGVEKQKRAKLASSIYEGRKFAPTMDEIVLIKAVIGKAYPPMIVWRAWAMLDPAEA